MDSPRRTPELLIPTGARLPDNNFDVIRLAMAFLVVWSHSFALYFIGQGGETNEPTSILTRDIYNSGRIAVLVFFTVSGFLICQSYEQSKSVAGYFKKRVLRIYPGYLVATTICAFVVVPLYSGVADFSAWQVIKTFLLNLLLQNHAPPSNVFGGTALNGSLWSIPYEFWCYIGLATLGVTGLLRSRHLLLAGTVIVMLTRTWLDLTGRKPGWGFVGEIIGFPYFWFMVLPSFMAGTLVYLYRDIIPRRGAILVVGIAVFLTASNLPIEPTFRKVIADFLFPAVCAYATFYFALSGSVRLHDAARFGDFSYGSYLYAFPIQQILFVTYARTISFPTYVALSMLLTLLAGMASWYLVERHFLPKRRIVALNEKAHGALL